MIVIRCITGFRFTFYVVFGRSMQEVHLDKHIKLLDSPGVVMTASSSDTSVILRNCVKVSPKTPKQRATAYLGITLEIAGAQYCIFYWSPSPKNIHPQ